MREQIILAWRTACYHRVKRMPDLLEELDAIERPAADGDDTERNDQTWIKVKAAVMAWNAYFDSQQQPAGA